MKRCICIILLLLIPLFLSTDVYASRSGSKKDSSTAGSKDDDKKGSGNIHGKRGLVVDESGCVGRERLRAANDLFKTDQTQFVVVFRFCDEFFVKARRRKQIVINSCVFAP